MQSPIIPYEIYRRYIYGSAYGRVSISGDVVGPTFIDEKPSRLERMFPDGNGRFGKGTEYHLFNLAANTWQLHYYRYFFGSVRSSRSHNVCQSIFVCVST